MIYCVFYRDKPIVSTISENLDETKAKVLDYVLHERQFEWAKKYANDISAWRTYEFISERRERGYTVKNIYHIKTKPVKELENGRVVG